MAGPSNPDEATNTEPVPQAARPTGSRPDSDWTAVSGTGDAEYGEPVAERDTADRGFSTSYDTPLESDVNQRIPAPDPSAAERAAHSSAGENPTSGDDLESDAELESDPQLDGGTDADFPADELGVPDATPSEDLAEGPPDGR
jgi:hypothetical protein